MCLFYLFIYLFIYFLNHSRIILNNEIFTTKSSWKKWQVLAQSSRSLTVFVATHVYRDIWDASLGETLEYEREPTNEKDRYAVAVKKSGTIVGHVPKRISN